MIDKRYQVKQLRDKVRLPEIYQFRVRAWENSPKKVFVNSELFSKGWSDDFEETAIHWIVEDEKGILIAAARINILTQIQEIPHHSRLELPTEMPMAVFSRLVVDAKHRRNGIGFFLKQVLMDFCKAHHIHWALAFATEEQGADLVQKLGWTIVGQIPIQFHNLTTESLSVNAILKKL